MPKPKYRLIKKYGGKVAWTSKPMPKDAAEEQRQAEIDWQARWRDGYVKANLPVPDREEWEFIVEEMTT